ncbi:hypothetical protein [Streptomyces sp. NBC_00306]|uniref:hypothetical protein n=1 Tax=Streptomyces sp. NBC_00306 TaxID=2975708 RepID=UPI002E2959CC|nr:hypothetical protein [Streptomyces sp. NBC_00306]
MTDDLSAGQNPEPSPRVRDELRALAAARRLSVDDHMFTAPGLPGTFRLQLFTAPGARPVAVATQIAGAEGMGLMNGVERFAGAVWERHCPAEDLPPVWVERQLWPEGELQETRFRRVMLVPSADRYRPRDPRWSVVTHEQLQDLVGAPVATDRGAGYLPRAAEPEGQLMFEEFAVARLARPYPFREQACMPAGVPWWRSVPCQVRRGAPAGTGGSSGPVYHWPEILVVGCTAAGRCIEQWRRQRALSDPDRHVTVGEPVQPTTKPAVSGWRDKLTVPVLVLWWGGRGLALARFDSP